MARESIGELHVALRASADQLAADISRDINASQGAIQARAVALGGVMAAGITAGLSVLAEGVQRAVSMAFAGLDRIDALDEAASKIGMSYNGMQDLKFAAETTGGTFEGITNAVGRMQAAISSGSGNSALTRLGLDAERLRALRPEDQFSRIAEALKGVQNTGDKIDLTKQIFGKGGVDILNVINSGADGLREMSQQVELMGGHLSAVQIQMANMANNELDRLKTGWAFIGDQIAVAVAPAVVAVGREIQKAVQNAGGMGPALEGWADKMVSFGASTANAAQYVSLVAGYIKTGLALLQSVPPYVSGIFTRLGAAFGVLKAQINQEVTEVKRDLLGLAYEIEVAYIKVINSVKSAASAVAKAIQSPAATIKSALGIAPDPVDPNWSPYGDQTGMPYDLPSGQPSGGPDASLLQPAPLPEPPKPIVVDYTQVGKATEIYTATATKSWKVVDDAVTKAGEDATLAALDANEALAELGRGEKWGDRVKAKAEELKKEAASIPAAVRASNDASAAVEDEAVKTGETRRAGVMRSKLSELDAIEQATIQSNNRIAEANQRSYDAFRQTSQSAVTNIVSSWVTGTAKISDIVSSWADRMVTQFIDLALWGNKSAGGSLGGLFGGGTGGGGLGAIVGGVTKFLGFANGGRPPMGRVSIVGERGPELFVPDSAGTIIPNGRASSMGGGQQRSSATTVESPVIINQTFQTGVTRAELAGAMDTVIDQTRGAVLDGVSRGGAYRKRLQA